MQPSPELLSYQEEQTDQGFNEKRAARILEGKQTDNSQVKKMRVPLKKTKSLLTRIGRKIKIAKKVISRRDKI